MCPNNVIDNSLNASTKFIQSQNNDKLSMKILNWQRIQSMWLKYSLKCFPQLHIPNSLVSIKKYIRSFQQFLIYIGIRGI